MITPAWYLLKVIICSGILFVYYFIALRNKIFHRWNRFYLLAAIILSLAVPLIKVNVFQKANADKGTVIHMLQTITNSDEIIVEYGRNNGRQLSYANIVAAGYMLVSVTFLVVFFLALQKIFILKKKYPATKLNGVNFISTDAKGTPFSFFNSIFWNNAIDPYSKQGHQIFNHEIVHIKEMHSYDKIFMNIVLLIFWINPFFWLMQKELSMIHEFIADKEALEDDDIRAFAEMVLQTVYPGQQFSITNNFFHSPLKRRLIMFTKNKNPKTSYISRLLALPLAAVIFFAFTLKMKTISNAGFYSGKKITVVIDAGHGGSDDGGVEKNIKEKDINLSIAKDIKELNKNENLNIILSRSADEFLTPQDRVNFAQANKADLFVSIHMDAETYKNTHSGLTIIIPKNDNAYLNESKLLGSSIIESFNKNYAPGITKNLQQLQRGIWVLKANQYPSVLIEPGFLSSQNDLYYLIKPENQQTIAGDILKGIENYAVQNIFNKSSNLSNISYTIPPRSAPEDTDLSSKAIFIVDGKIVANKEAKAGKASVIEITTKSAGNTQKDTIPDKVFTKVENEAEFPGGHEAWSKYIAGEIAKNKSRLTDKDFGTCLVKFIVNTDGSVLNVEDSTMKNTELAKIAVEAIRSGPKWIPATQNTHVVASYRLQPVTLTMRK